MLKIDPLTRERGAVPVRRWRWRGTMAALAALAGLVGPGSAGAVDGDLLAFGVAGQAPQAPWHWAGLPHQTKPHTQFEVVSSDGHTALRVESENAYGNLVHPLPANGPVGQLAWQWKLERLNEAADLHTREGDDTSLKVCVLWDLPLDNVPFVERQLLRAARAQSGQSLPAATVCYVWDAHLPEGTVLPNAYTGRLRYLVLHGPGAKLNEWMPQRRDLAADFMRLFGDETAQLPPLVAVGVGADSDNTHGHSVGYVAELQLLPR